MACRRRAFVPGQVDHGGNVPVFISKVGSEASADACLKGDVGSRATKLCKA